jgi:hypothetical protein
MSEQKTSTSIGFSNSILLMIMSVFFNGYALYKMYQWFIEHTFNLPHLSIFNAVGLMVLAGLFRKYKASEVEENSYDLMRSSLVNGLMVPLITLGLGYIVYLCM